MVRRSSLLTFLLALALVIQTGESSALASSDGHCAGFEAVTGCPNVSGEVGGDGATLSGKVTKPGGPGSPGSGAPGGSGSGGSTRPPMPCEEVFAGLCYGDGQGKPEEAAPGIPTVTWNDLAVFRPRPAIQYMQPDGWMVVGLPTNFVAVIERHVVSGTLLGAPADVRFTPQAYRWRYGDGSAARLGTTGASWQALGLREFDATPTSHIFRASGTYVIELDVEYTAEYRFAGGSWTPMSGVIVLPANDLIATAGEAVTVLVDRDCARAPAGPGC